MTEVSVLAEIGFKIDRLVETLTNRAAVEERERFERRREQKNRNPINAVCKGTVALGAGTVATLDLGGPQPGRRWVVKRVSFADEAGLSVASATATVDLFVAPGAGTVQVDNWVWRVTGSPGVATVSTEAVAVTPHDHLIVQVTGTTAHSYLVSVTVLDMDDAGRSKNVYDL